MNRKEYYDKLRKWEAEGYNVSELRHKWFPARTWLIVVRDATGNKH